MEIFPKSVRKLFNLEVLKVGDNALTGFVSQRNLLSLSKLKILYFSPPTLKFNFDPEWCPPFQLQLIRLGYVTGKLPWWLFTQSSLRDLTITHSTASFEQLENVLNLAGNYLSGSISPLLCHKMTDKSNLKILYPSKNLLSGELAACLNNWESLSFVGLEDSNLKGKIPHSIDSLSNLNALSLNQNNLFGEIPSSLKNCKKLLSLDLGSNTFSGTLPSWMGQSLKALRLRFLTQ
ncbi:hypothetical protein VNO78_19794 [Psophocarpus tetragonolobus]|uniref:Uncharacterized protein n=1 Tax=Psophocarpus tetragonolobus TaxID=3891 RepID=A0AAN9S878_PSOTE